MAQTLTNLNINDNNAVISALREGDEEVFDHIYRYYFRGLCAFCSQYVTLSESEEIVQDTMMWLWENRKTLIPELTLTYIIHSGFISGYQNRYGDNLKPPTNVYHRMTA